VLDLAALLEHEQLRGQLERARGLGFLGPGPVRAHVEHSRGFLGALESVGGRVVDLGSGGGVPGLIIAVARPDLTLVLLDATASRCRFLEDAVRQLGLAATVVEGRAEVLGHGPLRGTAAAVVARSFGPPAATAECAAPLLELGGTLVVSEPPEPAPDRWPSGGLAPLGLTPLHRSPGSPVVQVLRQVEPCPDAYPRRDGLPAKRPLF
jgi:16S rRNA (guanine527-N7)-methyltransferase